MTDSYILDNGWEAYIYDSKYMLHVKPILNNIFSTEQRIEIPKEIYNAIKQGERSVKELFRIYKLHNYIIQWKTAEKINITRVNTESRFYGVDYIVINEEDKYFMEYMLSTQGGGTRKIEISKDIYIEARQQNISTSQLFKKYDLYRYDKPEFDVLPDSSLFSSKE